MSEYLSFQKQFFLKSDMGMLIEVKTFDYSQKNNEISTNILKIQDVVHQD